jgi:hypothetical protein
MMLLFEWKWFPIANVTIVDWCVATFPGYVRVWNQHMYPSHAVPKWSTPVPCAHMSVQIGCLENSVSLVTYFILLSSVYSTHSLLVWFIFFWNHINPTLSNLYSVCSSLKLEKKKSPGVWNANLKPLAWAELESMHSTTELRIIPSFLWMFILNDCFI